MSHPQPPLPRFMRRFDLRGVDECWPWLGPFDKDGYGKWWGGRSGGWSTMAHRAAWQLLVGVVPPGLTIDHLCRNHACVNVDHMEPVTSRENTLRGESPIARAWRAGTCTQGHPRNDANTAIEYNGTLRCRVCRRKGERGWVPH